MSRKRISTPKAVETAHVRVAGMKAISPALDFGDGVSVTTMETAIGNVLTEMEEYNSMLSSVDEKGNQLGAAIKELNELNVRTLNAGKFKYGPDSSEYEMLGGCRRSERKRPRRKPSEPVS